MQAQSALIKEQTCCPFLYRGISLSYYYPSMSILANSSATALFCTATLCKYLCCYYSVHDYALAFSWICIQRVTDDYSRNHLARDTDSNPHSMSLKNGGDNTIALIFFSRGLRNCYSVRTPRPLLSSVRWSSSRQGSITDDRLSCLYVQAVLNGPCYGFGFYGPSPITPG